MVNGKSKLINEGEKRIKQFVKKYLKGEIDSWWLLQEIVISLSLEGYKFKIIKENWFEIPDKNIDNPDNLDWDMVRKDLGIFKIAEETIEECFIGFTEDQKWPCSTFTNHIIQLIEFDSVDKEIIPKRTIFGKEVM